MERSLQGFRFRSQCLPFCHSRCVVFLDEPNSDKQNISLSKLDALVFRTGLQLGYGDTVS